MSTATYEKEQQTAKVVNWMKKQEDKWSEVVRQLASEAAIEQPPVVQPQEVKSAEERKKIPQLHLNNIGNFLSAPSPGQLTASSVSSNSTTRSTCGSLSMRLSGVPPLMQIPNLQLSRVITQLSSRSQASGRLETPSSLSSDRTIPDRYTPLNFNDDNQYYDTSRGTPTRTTVPTLHLNLCKNEGWLFPQASNISSSPSHASQALSPGLSLPLPCRNDPALGFGIPEQLSERRYVFPQGSSRCISQKLKLLNNNSRASMGSARTVDSLS